MYPQGNAALQQLYNTGYPTSYSSSYSTPVNRGSYWRGQDGQVWVAGSNGTNSAGNWDANTESYWKSKGYNLISDPNASGNQTQIDNGSTYYGGGGTGGGAPAAPKYNQQDLDLLDLQRGNYESALSRIANQRTIGEGNINSSYTAGDTALRNQRTTAEGNYNTQKARSGQDYVNSRSAIGSQAGNQLNSIRRILGANGAGWSSAYSKLAPYAAALQASQRFGDVQSTFDRNQSDMDNAWTATQNDFTTQKANLDADKQNKLNELYAGLGQRETEINNSLSDLALRREQLIGGANVMGAIQPYQSRIQQLLGEIDNYGKLSIAQPKAISYANPDLADYNYSKFDQPEVGADRRASYVSPFARLLREREDKNRMGY